MKDTTCLYCGKEFKTKRSSRKYCSGLCRQYAYMSRKGFDFGNAPDNNMIDIETIEEESITLYDELIVTDNNIVTATDSKYPVNHYASLNGDMKKSIDDKEHDITDSKNVYVNREIENNTDNKENIVYKSPVIEEENFIANDHKENNVLVRKLIPEKSEWIPYRNSFLKDLDDLYKRDYKGMPFSKKYYQWWSSDQWAYVSMCNSALYYFLHKLLYFDRSNEPVSVRELKELHEDIFYEQQSYCYSFLPEEYPYFDFFRQLESSVARWADYYTAYQHQKAAFKIHPAFKLKIYCVLRQLKPEPAQEYYTLSAYDKEN